MSASVSELEQLARLRALQLQVRHVVGALDDLDVEALLGGCAAEVVAVGRERRDDEDALLVVAGVVDGAVAEHLAALVAERAVAHLADREAGHVAREAVVGGGQRVGTAEEPLLERRLVPQADRLAHRVVLPGGIAEVGDPVPALPLRELAAHAALDRVERRVAQRAGRQLVVARVLVLGRLRRDARGRGRERGRRVERRRGGVERGAMRHLERQDDRRRRAARDLLVARRQHLGDAEQRARGGDVRKRLVLLEAAQRLAVDRAAQAAQARLLAGADAGRREDRLLDVALDDLVAEQPDVAAARAAGARASR